MRPPFDPRCLLPFFAGRRKSKFSSLFVASYCREGSTCEYVSIVIVLFAFQITAQATQPLYRHFRGHFACTGLPHQDHRCIK